jgi:thiol-disulfide isomerase/thioredoxin
VLAQPIALKPFTFESYQQILEDHAMQPFMLVIWSIDCPSCVKDMALIEQIHQNQPELKIVMLSTDDVSASEQIEKILQQNHLADLENWVFADTNSQKLRYQIDPKWYGELPRTYFFDAAHHREGISGVLSQEKLDAQLKRALK